MCFNVVDDNIRCSTKHDVNYQVTLMTLGKNMRVNISMYIVLFVTFY